VLPVGGEIPGGKSNASDLVGQRMEDRLLGHLRHPDDGLQRPFSGDAVGSEPDSEKPSDSY
jgi:hypothetical protein